MFSSTHGSQCDSEYNYIPGYVIEDESNDTSREIGTLETVKSEILGDYDAYCLYSDEPLASQECSARYLKLYGTQGTKRDATMKITRP
jgi:UDP-N-acetylglucosamine pyrophosphorylase